MKNGTPKRAERSTEKERAQAFDLYLKGHTFDQIAETLNRGRITIIDWKRKEKWDEKRKKVGQKAEKNILDRYREEIESISSKCLKVSEIMSRIALEEMVHIQEKYPVPPRTQKVLRSLNEWGKLTLLASNIQKNTIPEANEELAKQIHRELKLLREKK